MQHHNKSVKIKDFEINNVNPFILIAGPCAIESKDHAFDMASKIKEICIELEINFIYKSSFDKANRTSIASSRGVGMEEGLKILSSIKKELDISIITDVHEKEQCQEVASVVDILQIPAFLCRQTDLLNKAAHTGKAVMVKKGQFLAPWEMANVAEKIASTGNKKILLCERGTSFGYNTLVNDFRGLEIMAETGYPIVFDATHSVQQPGGRGNSSGGERKFVAALARAACAVGVSAVFIETHQDPDNAPCDGPNMIDIANLQDIIEKLRLIDELIKAN